MSEFRFEDMLIWQDGMTLSITLFSFADLADEKRKYRFAEQLRAATMSITNNIAEGSGSDSNRDFARFLTFSKRSVFECVNILHIYEASRLITKNERTNLYPQMVKLSKQIANFRKALLKGKHGARGME